MPAPLDRLRLRSLATRLLADPVARLLARLGLTPNHVTLLGLLLSGGVAYLIARGWLLAAGALLVVAGAFDLLDGALARLKGQATPFGALLDSVSDRLSEALALLGVLVLALDRGSDTLSLLVFLALTGSVMVSYIRARSEGLGIPGDVGLATRPERLLILVVGLLADQLTIAMGVIAALVFFTVAQRMLHAWRSLK